MKTRVYIDGYNLHYGCLKNGPHKWLDVVALFERIIQIQNPASEIEKVVFFTANCKQKYSSTGLGHISQHSYHRALQAAHGGRFEIVKGFYSDDIANLPLAEKPLDLANRVEVVRLEEKQSDVQLALHIYRDAIQGAMEQAVLVSNDTDQEPPLQFIRDAALPVAIGVVLPVQETATRPVNKRLSKLADWTRTHIRDEELAAAQLPNMVPARKKPIYKPSHW